jgi:two-component system OmpR family response regulator
MGSILIVDDEVDICLLVTQYLTKLGYEATFSLTMAGALENIARTSYDLLFVDLNLTDGSGYDLMKVLQDSKSASKVIVISAQNGERQKALQSGANIFLSKPFTKRSIEDSLQQLDIHAK